MGDLIRFPQERRTVAVEDDRDEPAVVLILPVVRVERTPGSSGPTGRRRRRVPVDPIIAAYDAAVRLDALVSPDTEERVRGFLDDLRNL